MQLYELSRAAGLGTRISTTPRQARSSCGVALLVTEIAIGEAVKKLADREKKVIDLRYYKGRTQMEIAEEIGISQAQVSRLEKSALEKIKKEL